jgi:hypothetical protein
MVRCTSLPCFGSTYLTAIGRQLVAGLVTLDELLARNAGEPCIHEFLDAPAALVGRVGVTQHERETVLRWKTTRNGRTQVNAKDVLGLEQDFPALRVVFRHLLGEHDLRLVRGDLLADLRFRRWQNAGEHFRDVIVISGERFGLAKLLTQFQAFTPRTAAR